MHTEDIEVNDDGPRTTTAGVALPLTDPRARRAALTGGKAASLAEAAGAGLPVLPGFVVLPPGTSHRGQDLRDAWRKLSANGSTPLIVRSSSAAEDTEDSSMAGQFTSVLDVRGWDAFRDALRTVRASSAEPMAVLVQPMVRSRVGGVLFGADPVAGRTDRLLVSVVPGGPDTLVSGERPGTEFLLTRHGRLLRTEPGDPADRLLHTAELHRLTTPARRTRHVFGRPQDMEFGFDEETGRLWLFQSRPIPAMAPRPARRARLLGPGPVAETLPGLLRPLEEDLWVVPMAHGLATALDLGGTAARHTLRTTPVVTAVAGHAVADLALLGMVPPRHRWLALLDPLPAARRLGAAWRVGRLRSSLPHLATALLADVDRQLSEAPPPSALSPAGLTAALRWSRGALVALHAQEALAGALLTDDRPGSTAAAAALAALHHGRAEGLTDAQTVAARPEVLALIPPSLTEPPRLPARGVAGTGPGTGTPTPREALRMRIRWVQEFQVALVREVAAHSVDVSLIALLRWPELVTVAEGGPLPADLAQRRAPQEGTPLPDAFRLADDGTVVARRAPGRADGRGGQGVSGGRAEGGAWDGTGQPPRDAVLVVRNLDPALAPLLPLLTGLIAQTGSPLSHLAVLARELGLPVVTGTTGAVDRYPPGTRLLLDGATGEIGVREHAGQGASS
ncbi:PEP/pyruvate-binding domain-containing protein [Streptomyces specialis]|uniref:PEP/pyruvate-binding domain-containing protein n=1 Tax=Streptomyces specialis TaxID=498367 RepID=UPI00073E5C58|nr:PEP/pyruvate-binding domain-containing protein [Streptomyces specialis]